LCISLILILAVLFRQSFSESQLLFANDAPLGQLTPQKDESWGNFRGVWLDLNWVGFTQPSALPNISAALYIFLKPVGFLKFYAPVALLILGLSAALFFRQLGFRRMAVVLGGLAAALNTDPFSYACWGLPSLTLCMAAIFLALAALVARPGRLTWVKLALGGLLVGFSITEGFDNGAIFSLYIAAFVMFQAWVEWTGGPAGKLAKGAVRVTVVAAFAAFMAAQAISTLVGTQVQGISGMAQDTETKQRRWDEATIGSLPKIETLRVVIPGLFGYRMDTSEGGNYWGAVGQSPGVPQSRHSGAGVYAGILVVLVAVWAFARSLAAKAGPFTDRERRFIWFWAGAAVLSLLFAFGRHAPFYRFIYALPYFSTIRMPYKFMHPFAICIVTLFAYGLEGLARQYLVRDAIKAASFDARWKAWKTTASRFDRRWAAGSAVLVAAGLFGWLLYSSSRVELLRHLEAAGFGKGELAEGIARFSFAEVRWFVLHLALAAGAVFLVMTGIFSGGRAKWAAWMLGGLLVIDFTRANAPWVVYENYVEKYAPNPVVELLRHEPHEHRVTAQLNPRLSAYLGQKGEDFAMLYDRPWKQELFPYYGIQCLDIIQMPRTPVLDEAYFKALGWQGGTNLFQIARLWQLTNTRYQIGMTPFLELLNTQIDPVHRGFRVLTNFDFAPRPGTPPGQGVRIQDITAVLNPKGGFAIFELTNALPRAKLYSQWQVGTDDATSLATLASPSFDPLETVLISQDAPTTPPGASGNPPPGAARITEYHPKLVRVRTESATPSVLLLNDKYHPDWKVTVDGQSATLLRANFIMRGVHLPAGGHTVEFRFDPPHGMLFVSLAALAAAFALWGVLAFTSRNPAAASPDAGAA
jgi:hypothetical protein